MTTQKREWEEKARRIVNVWMSVPIEEWTETLLASQITQSLEEAYAKGRHDSTTYALIMGEKVAQLVKAARDVLGLIDAGWLVRNTDGDHEPGWAMKQIEPCRKLKALYTALKEFEGERGASGGSSDSKSEGLGSIPSSPAIDRLVETARDLVLSIEQDGVMEVDGEKYAALSRVLKELETGK